MVTPWYSQNSAAHLLAHSFGTIFPRTCTLRPSVMGNSEVGWKFIFSTRLTKWTDLWESFYATASVVAGGIMFPECSCVHAFVHAWVPNKHCYHDILCPGYFLNVVWPNFYHSLDFKAGMNTHFGVKGEGSRSRWHQICSKMHFLTLLAWYFKC